MRLLPNLRSNKMKLNFILISICAFLILLINQYQTTIEEKNTLIKTYQRNQNTLTQKIKDIYNEKNILMQQNKELSKAAQKDNFNWNEDISNTLVIKRLQKN